MKTLNALDWTALVLLIIGGINWGLIVFLVLIWLQLFSEQ